jgi:hypothetical protein
MAVVLVTLASALAALTPFSGAPQYFKHWTVALGLLAAFVGLGALFGKVLGDFLRAVN